MQLGLLVMIGIEDNLYTVMDDKTVVLKFKNQNDNTEL